MSIRIDRVQGQVKKQPVAQTEKQQQRRELHSQNIFERNRDLPRSIEFADGSSIAIPRMGEQMLTATIEGQIASLPSNQQGAVMTATDSFAKSVLLEAKSAQVSGLGAVSSGIKSAFDASAQTYAKNVPGASQEDAINGTIAIAMTRVEGDVADFAKQVMARTEAAKNSRLDMTELKDALSDWPDDGSKRAFSWTEFSVENGQTQSIEHSNIMLSKEEAQNKVSELSRQVDSLSGLMEMDKFELQQRTEVMTQAFAILSAIFKDSHDQAKGMIGNLR